MALLQPRSMSRRPQPFTVHASVRRPLPGLNGPSAVATAPSVFTTGEASRSGVHPARLKRSDLRSLGRSLWAATQADVAPLDLLHSLQQLHPTGVFSHTTAAVIWGMWLPRSVSGTSPVHIAKVRGHGGSARRTGVRGHRLSPHADVLVVGGLRVTSPAWTWVDLAQELGGLEDLVVAGDSLLQRETGAEWRRRGRPPRTVTVAGLEATVRRRPGVRGIVLARAALERLCPGADAPTESRLRHRLVEAGFPRPVVNPHKVLSSGRWVMLDLFWEDLLVCLEFDGDQHRIDNRQWQSDRVRARELDVDGIHVVRVTGEVFTREGWRRFVRDLDLLLRRQAERLGVPVTWRVAI